MINTPDVEVPTKILNEELRYLMDTCFPVRRVVMSSRDSPWITSLVKYLLRKELLIRATFTKWRTCHRRPTVDSRKSKKLRQEWSTGEFALVEESGQNHPKETEISTIFRK